jgi:hypothetical protein
MWLSITDLEAIVAVRGKRAGKWGFVASLLLQLSPWLMAMRENTILVVCWMQVNSEQGVCKSRLSMCCHWEARVSVFETSSVVASPNDPTSMNPPKSTKLREAVACS